MPARRFIPPKEPVRLSNSVIESYPSTGREYYVRDLGVPRLHLKVSAAGKKTFVLRYNTPFVRGRKYKLGDFPDLNIQAARRVAAQKLLEAANGNDPSEARRRQRASITLQELGERFMEEHAELHLKPSTISGYLQILRTNVQPKLGGRSLLSITKQDVQALHRDMKLTPYSANRTLILIRRLFNWAADNALHPEGHNPAKGIKQYPEKKVERLLTLEEMERVGEAIDWARTAHPASGSALNAIVFMFHTACRRGEAFRLRWENVDFQRNELHIIGGKTGDRPIPLSPDLRSWLLELRESSTTQFLFPGRLDGKPITDIKKTWQAVRQRAGIPELRIHDIRHNVISDVALSSDVATAQAVGGHADMRSTMRYIHARKKIVEAAFDEVGRRATKALLQRGSTS